MEAGWSGGPRFEGKEYSQEEQGAQLAEKRKVKKIGSG